MDLLLDVEQIGELAFVSARGEIDAFTAPRLREQLIDLAESGRARIVVDLGEVDFLDSTGLGTLVAGLKRVKAREGTLSLVCTRESILKIFRITGLTKVFPIHGSREAALAAAPQDAEGSEA